MEYAYLQKLNNKQKEAVTTTSQYCRVIAGAGSGKTRVLTSRFIYLLDENNCYPNEILAITFTNKAAKEIKDRIVSSLENINSTALNIYTFHSFCARFLRREIEAINVPKSFGIVDEEDVKSILKRILKSEGYDSKSLMYKDMMGYISYQKNLGLYPSDVVIKSYNPKEKEKLHIYKLYQEELERSNQLDFDDLLLKAIEILRNFPDIRHKWQRYFSNILIDEFQDTNDIQYELVELLLTDDTALYVVGDPDQTIYTWRGANQNILLNMDQKFPDIETIILEENYRSTVEILSAANKLIDNNKKRIKKNLFTSNANGLPVVYNDFYDAYSETRYVIQTIQNLVNQGNYMYKDIVIMYRSAYLTLPFERLLVQNQIPYVIYGGQKFYQRMEVKDVLAYLRLLINKNDNVSLERILNVPRRGIGDTSIERLRQESIDANLTYYEYLKSADKDFSEIPTKAFNEMKALINTLDNLTTKLGQQSINDFMNTLLNEIQYKEYLSKTEENYEDRWENVETLITDIISVMKGNSDLTLSEYLENISLMSAQDYVEDNDALTLMTVHTAKGLEFPVVFLVGLNEGVFPSARTIEESAEDGLEEERRVCYVAFTRAMQRLYVSSFHVGFKGQIQNASCFVKEAELKDMQRKYREMERERNNYQNRNYYANQNIYRRQEVTSKPRATISLSANSTNNIKWKIGDRLKHITFGYGIVIGVEETNISVRFNDGNIKKLLGNHSSITKLEGDGNNAA